MSIQTERRGRNIQNYEIYGNILGIIPLLTSKIYFSYKFIFYIFVEMFTMIYMYIYSESTLIEEFYVMNKRTLGTILLYSFYWKYILYNTKDLEVGRNNMHIYAINANLCYYIEGNIKKIIRWMNELGYYLNEFYMVSCVSIIYIIIGLIVYKKYETKERNVLYSDYMSRKKLITNSIIVLMNEIIYLEIIERYGNQIVFSAPTLIGSMLFITINGKLMNIPYKYLIYGPSLMYIIIICTLTITDIKSIRDLCVIITIGVKYIMFECKYKLLQITSKKDVIELYINYDIIVMVLGTFMVQMKRIMYGNTIYDIYVMMMMIICTIIMERRTLKMNEKDEDITECIKQINDCQL